ncbi:MAG TPA: SDR family oxidoreductase [Allosphingosinicella sp.]|nr:SDR family oxidoreductase [Allosphingosinicella sp.]
MTRIAIITGGGSGIGRSAALALARRHYAVVLAGRTEARLAATAADVVAAGGEALAVVTEVTDEASVAALFRAAVERFGRVDLLFNNAGQGPALVPLEELALTDWQRVIDVNLTGVFLCLREAFRVMKAQRPQGGRIINNGSISAHVPRPDSIDYTASKHAVTGLTRTASLDGRKYDIAVSQIDIGNAASGLTDAFGKGVKQADGSVRAEPVMNVDNVGETIAHIDSLPLEANVQFMTLMATKMPYIGRG